MTRHDLPTLVNNRVVSAFRKGFIFAEIHENKTLAKISEFTVFPFQNPKHFMNMPLVCN